MECPLVDVIHDIFPGIIIHVNKKYYTGETFAMTTATARPITRIIAV